MLALALAAVPLARADGDPASDVLYGSNLFPSYDSGISAANLQALKATIDDSKKAGYEIRVAVIAKPDDLGSVTVPLGEAEGLRALPRHRARNRLQGPRPHRDAQRASASTTPTTTPTPAYAALKTIQSGSGDQLAQAATDSVATLARQAGHPFTPHTISASSSSSSRTPLIAGAAEPS